MILLLAIGIPCAVSPEKGTAFANKILGSLTGPMGWLFLWFTIAVFCVLGWLALSKIGRIRIGGDDARPEFRMFSWFAMLFCAGLGSGLMYWSTIEWAYYFTSPPLGIEAKSMEAADWSLSYAFFHWGFTAWAIYCIPCLPIAYAFYNKKIPNLRISASCRGIIGDAADGWLGKVIDICFMFGLIGGMTTSMGLGTPMLSEGISRLLGIQPSFVLDMAIIGIWTVIFSTSVWFGLKKGIKRLSDYNTYLLIGVLIFILLCGPTVYILNNFTNSVGIMFDNIVRLSLFTDPHIKSGFPQGWTIFYWGWWISLAPFMGLFVARISKGRTIREIIFAQVVIGSFGCWAFHAIIGGTAMNFDINGVLPVSQLLTEKGAPYAIISFIRSLPLGSFLLVVWVGCAFISLATCLDSAAYTLSFVASDNVHEGQEPPRWHRLVWAFSLAGVTVVLLVLGGLKPLQTIAVASAFPLIFIMGLSIASFIKWVKADVNGEAAGVQAKKRWPEPPGNLTHPSPEQT